MSISLVDEFIIQVQEADIFQNEFQVLRHVNFNIRKGEFTYLIGRTGSGKTSLIKTLYADLPLKKGEISIAGYSLNDIKRKEIPYLRRKLGMVFQDFQLLTDRSVGENLLFVLRATGWKNLEKMQDRIAEVLMLVGLSGSSKKMPHQLSGGEQQRLAIARALLNDPLILFADEATGNLDPTVSEEILKLFQKINNRGTAILMATHDYNLIQKFPARTLQCWKMQVKEGVLP